MKFTSEIKKILKKTYKSIKKGLNSFLTTLGFSKKETYDLSQKISEKIHKEISEHYKSKGIDEETKKSFDSVMLELKMENEMKNPALKPIANLEKQNQKEKYKDILAEFNSQEKKQVRFNDTIANRYFDKKDPTNKFLKEEIENERE